MNREAQLEQDLQKVDGMERDLVARLEENERAFATAKQEQEFAFQTRKNEMEANLVQE